MCPYHAWCYASTASCRHPERRQGRARPRRARPLAGVTSRSWQGFVFVNLDADPRRRCASRSPTSTTRRSRSSASTSTSCGSATGPCRGRGQLEDPDRELQRVPALPDGASRAGRRHPRLPQGWVFEDGPRRRAAWRSPTAATASPRTGTLEPARAARPERPRRGVAVRVRRLPEHVHRRDRHGAIATVCSPATPATRRL